MSNLTKKAIEDAFITLLDEQPLNRITVKDIVETCGIHRNSFYYHFEDLPALLEEIIADRVQTLIGAHPTVDSLEEGFDAALEFVLENKRAVLHIYNSLSRDVFERYLMDVCEYVVKTYVEADFADRPVDQNDKEMIIRYHKCECFGNIIDWLNGKMEDDISAYFHRIYQLKRGWEGEVLRRDTNI